MSSVEFSPDLIKAVMSALQRMGWEIPEPHSTAKSSWSSQSMAPVAARSISDDEQRVRVKQSAQLAPPPGSGPALMSCAAAQLLPIDLRSVQLVDAATCASTGDASVSLWLQWVRDGIAPKPVISRPRFTRWRATEVAAFWRRVADEGAADAEAQKRMSAHAKAASARAREPEAIAKATAARAAKAQAKGSVAIAGTVPHDVEKSAEAVPPPNKKKRLKVTAQTGA